MSLRAHVCFPPTTSYKRTSVAGPPFQAGSPHLYVCRMTLFLTGGISVVSSCVHFACAAASYAGYAVDRDARYFGDVVVISAMLVGPAVRAYRNSAERNSRCRCHLPVVAGASDEHVDVFSVAVVYAAGENAERHSQKDDGFQYFIVSMSQDS